MEDYVRAVLYNAGFKNPTDEVVNQICVTAEKAGIASNADSHFIVDALVAVLRAYYPVAKALEFMENMQKLQSQAGHTQEELNGLKESILSMAEGD